MPAILTLIRHGEAAGNVAGVWQGSTDSELTERGRQQADKLADYARRHWQDADALWASPLSRARGTAEPISDALDLECELDPGLAEMSLGNWEGRSFETLNDAESLWHHLQNDADYLPHGGESPRIVAERAASSLRRIGTCSVGRVLVVAHGGALSLALGLILDAQQCAWNRLMHNAAFSELVLEPAPTLLSFNETEHLQSSD